MEKLFCSLTEMVGALPSGGAPCCMEVGWGDPKRKLDDELNHRPARNNSNYLLISNCPSEDNKTPLRVWTLTVQTDRRTRLSDFAVS